ncbi:MAG: hypothetical protein LBK59_08115 [Bifidobacteriaceae bacterium]|jgi:hypothetical protein|nr:hypothetical protein [Bifidobacteriaceae bacterium]
MTRIDLTKAQLRSLGHAVHQSYKVATCQAEAVTAYEVDAIREASAEELLDSITHLGLPAWQIAELTAFVNEDLLAGR